MILKCAIKEEVCGRARSIIPAKKRLDTVLRKKGVRPQINMFMKNYRYKACEPGMTEKIVEMAINSSGIRDTARVLKINKNTVINTLKKRKAALSK